MTSRREFLEAAALSALPAIAGNSVAAATVPTMGLPTKASPNTVSAFKIVLFDARYPQARNVATRIIRAGATTLHALADGDITHVWLNEIGPAWQRGPAVVAGLTARPALFCLEQFALSSGMRVVFHAEHVVHPDGQTEHSLLRGAESLRLSSSDLKQAGPRWDARIADALMEYRPRPATQRFGRSEAALEPDIPPQSQLLTSWIIAAGA
jgi:hypothetical protein